MKKEMQMKKVSFLIGMSMALLASAASAQTKTSADWRATTFQATDVGVGANGALWFVNGSSIFQMTSSGPRPVQGSGVRIAVDPNGLAWTVNASGLIYRCGNTSCQQMPGSGATDIGIGANGTVWIIGAGGALLRWNPSTNGWVQLPTGNGARVSVDPSGNPWVVNAQKQIWRYTGSAWQQLPGAGNDIGVGADGTVFTVGTTTTPGAGGSQVSRFIPSTSSWRAEMGIFGVSVAAGPAPKAFATRSSGLTVWERIGTGF